MKALVTGAGGFVGNHVVRVLLDAGHEVRALLLPREPRTNVEGLDTRGFDDTAKRAAANLLRGVRYGVLVELLQGERKDFFRELMRGPADWQDDRAAITEAARVPISRDPYPIPQPMSTTRRSEHNAAAIAYRCRCDAAR